MKKVFLLLATCCCGAGFVAQAQGTWDTSTTGVAHTTTLDSVGIGITQPASKLHLNNGDFVVSKNGTTNFKVSQNGLVWAREVLVNLDTIPDYVFEPNYKRMNLFDLEKYLQANCHLPGIPSAAAYQQAGAIDIGKLELKLLEKVEELTLYLIELKHENELLKAQILHLSAGSGNK